MKLMDKIPDTFTIREYKYNLGVIKILELMVYFAYAILIVTFIWALFHNPVSIFGLIGVIFIALFNSLLYLWVRTWKKENDRLAKKNEDTWGLGAVAELMVQEELESLPRDYRIISDFGKSTGGNIDFIVICPRGIFAIEVKANGGLIKFFDNQLHSFDKPLFEDPIHQTVGNATYLSDLLEQKIGKRYFVQGILEFPRGQIDKTTIHGKIDHIWIGEAGFHKYAIKKSQVFLSKEEMGIISNIISTKKPTL